MDRITTIDPKQVSAELNKCFLEYDPDWAMRYGEPTTMNSFKYYIERTAGMKLDFSPETKKNQFGYRLDKVEIVDEKKYTMFILRYSS